MECRIFFVGYSCNVRSSLSLMSVDDPNSTETRTIHCNWRFLLCKHHRVSLQLTSSLMAELFPRRLKAILSHISRSVPFLSCYYQYHRLRLCTRWPSSLTSASKFQRACPFLLGYKKFFYDGAIFTQLYFVIQDPNSTWRRTNHVNNRIILKHHRVSRHPNQTADVCQPVSSSERLEP